MHFFFTFFYKKFAYIKKYVIFVLFDIVDFIPNKKMKQNELTIGVLAKPLNNLKEISKENR